jgi:hypothetical protein
VRVRPWVLKFTKDALKRARSYRRAGDSCVESTRGRHRSPRGQANRANSTRPNWRFGYAARASQRAHPMNFAFHRFSEIRIQDLAFWADVRRKGKPHRTGPRAGRRRDARRLSCHALRRRRRRSRRRDDQRRPSLAVRNRKTVAGDQTSRRRLHRRRVLQAHPLCFTCLTISKYRRYSATHRHRRRWGVRFIQKAHPMNFVEHQLRDIHLPASEWAARDVKLAHCVLGSGPGAGGSR